MKKLLIVALLAVFALPACTISEDEIPEPVIPEVNVDDPGYTTVKNQEEKNKRPRL